MPRKTADEEVKARMDQFFTEARESLTSDILQTIQPKRRSAALKEIDALDRVYDRYYNWINRVKTDAA